MAKWYDVIGFIGDTVETAPGVWVQQMIERPYFGDVVRDTRRLEEAAKVNDDLNVNNSISVVADAYAGDHIFAMRYIMWSGVRWITTDVEVQHPRLLIRLGGIYNGPTPGSP